MSDIAVRLLNKTEASLFRKIRLEALQKNPEAFTSSYQEEEILPLQRFEEQVEKAAIFVVFDGKEPVGVAALGAERSLKKSHIGRLWSVYVRDSARRKGAGSKLLEAVLDHAIQHFDLIQLTVSAANPSARRLYEKAGFEEYGFEKFAVKYNGAYADEVLMMKPLKISQAS